MGVEYELTWFESRQCWKKKRQGNVYYCPIRCNGKSDYDGYRASLKWWHDKQAELNAKKGERPESEWTEEEKRINEWWTTRPDRHLSETGRAVMADRRARNAAVPKDQTVGAMIKHFLDLKRSQAVTGQRSKGRFVNLRLYAEQFGASIGNDKPITDLTAMTLSDYHAKQLREMASGTITSYCARDRMQVARQFINKCWELGAIELPRNIRSRDLNIQLDPQEIEVFEFGLLRTLIRNAPELHKGFYPLKLYLLLMASVGMTQKDISDLLRTQVDYQRGTITRKRSKTKNHKDVPKVIYKLWPVALELLKKYRNKKSERVLTNRDGGILCGTTLNPKNDKASKVDFIRDVYLEYCDAEKIKHRKSLTCIRNTSSSKIGEHPEFGKFAQYWLGHSAQTVADKHYVKPTQQQFDRCVLWLGQQYGFVPAESTPRQAE